MVNDQGKFKPIGGLYRVHSGQINDLKRKIFQTGSAVDVHGLGRCVVIFNGDSELRRVIMETPEDMVLVCQRAEDAATVE